jgi:cytochrome c peroxidase
MRSTSKIILTGITMLVVFTSLALRQADKPAEQVKQQLLSEADSLIGAIHNLRAIPVSKVNERILQNRFRQVRLAYKRMEWATEYFDPLTTRQFNGPPVPEAELSGQVIQPDGLQVIETYFFPRFTAGSKQKLSALLKHLAENAANFKYNFEKDDIQDWQVIDAAKLEVFRVETLGLNDFDDPLQKNCFAESATALQSVCSAIRYYIREVNFSPAIQYLAHPVAFDQFNRADFVINYANPLTRKLSRLYDQLNLPDIHYNRLLNQKAATLFDENSFNRNAYIASMSDSATPEKIALGKKLFFDPILSGSMTRSCSSCHQPAKAFTDGLVKNLDITGKKFVARNTPTLINAALQPAQFYDLRAPSLEDQVNDVVQNQDEMHGDMLVATGRLWKNNDYRKLFSQAYPVTNRTAIDTFEVMNALASYVRSLTALNSRFDEYMRGGNMLLSQAEVNGFNLFMGKARCSTCHYLPLFSSALPPRYMQMDAEIIGVPKSKNSRQIDPDEGTYGIQPLGFNRHAFKTPSIRNASLTAPYMHNGAFNTLDEVVDFYNRGGGAGMGIRVPNQTLATDQLHLTKTEKAELVAFMKSLDSR